MTSHPRYTEEQKHYFTGQLLLHKAKMEPVIEAYLQRFPGAVFGPPQFRYLRSMIGNDPRYGAPLLQPGVPGIICVNRRSRRTARAREQAPSLSPTTPMEAPAPPPAPMEAPASEQAPVEAPAQSLAVDDGNLGFNIGIAGWDLGLPGTASDVGLDLGPGSEEADLEFLGQLMAAASPDGGMGYPTATSSMDSTTEYPTTTSSMESVMEYPAITNSMDGAMPTPRMLDVAGSSPCSTSQLPQSMGASIPELPSPRTAACDGINCLIPKDYRHTHGADGSVTFENGASVVDMVRRAIMEVDPAYSGEMTMNHIHGRG